ncbi:MAG TPA: formate--tetrahydrofolate ligase [Lentisphaeria bacterium]|nr:MAG: formate--tetrahydrofolate ligase [Lentisphaerae bacterium GWF2_38_69]HBM15350.1 formate--tetrahydrofolate ligase [Lentisphaeria bacterium]
MKSDIEIAQATKLKPIGEIAKSAGILDKELEPYGHTKGKVTLDILDRLKGKPNGKLVVVTAINPTPLGEGKTVTTIGASLGLAKIDKKVFTCIRQPSMGPVFGIKGGAAGGGYSQVIPMEDFNINLTGDIHAITAAHNLGAAALDTRLYHEERKGYEDFARRSGLKALKIDKDRIFWKRVVDINDRALRSIEIGLHAPGSNDNDNGIPRHTNFDISVASELMAILALAENLQDMRKRFGKCVMALNINGDPITAEDLGIAGSMTVIMKDAIKPTLMQTTEHTPCFVHAGPFANIAHGNSSIIADRIALKLADYVITEAGFGSDMGFEKFCDIKTRYSGINPNAAVVVCTVRALKSHSGRFKIVPGKPLDPKLVSEDLESLELGLENLKAHIVNINRFGIPAVVAINKFATDSDKEIAFLKEKALEFGAYRVAVSQVHGLGGEGGKDIAQAIVEACDAPSKFKMLYEDKLSLIDKINIISKEVYSAGGVEFSELALKQLEFFQKSYGHLPICMAKTQYSLSHDPNMKGWPKNYSIPVREVFLSAGAGFIYVLTGLISTMPGLGTNPSYTKVDIDEKGNIIGLF